MKVESDPVLQQCKLVVAALEGSASDELPVATHHMLMEVMSASTRQLPEQRSHMAKSLVDIAARALAAIQDNLQQYAREVRATLESADGERVIREAAILREESCLVSAHCKAAEMKKIAASHNETLKGALGRLNHALESQESGDVKFKELSEEKRKMEVLERDVYAPTKEGLLTKQKSNKNAKELMAIGKSYGFDESLLVGLPGALTKKPDDRSGFDTMVLTAFEAQVMTRIAELDKSIAEEMPGREERAAVVQSARAAHETVKADQDASIKELTAAQAAIKDGEGLVQEAKRSLQNFNMELKRLTLAQESAELRLNSFTNGPLAAFRSLEAGTPLAMSTDSTGLEDMASSEEDVDEEPASEEQCKSVAELSNSQLRTKAVSILINAAADGSLENAIDAAASSVTPSVADADMSDRGTADTQATLSETQLDVEPAGEEVAESAHEKVAPELEEEDADAQELPTQDNEEMEVAPELGEEEEEVEEADAHESPTQQHEEIEAPAAPSLSPSPVAAVAAEAEEREEEEENEEEFEEA
jgi:hypothetical protein